MTTAPAPYFHDGGWYSDLARSWEGGALLDTFLGKSWRGGTADGGLIAKSWQGGTSLFSLPAKSWQGGTADGGLIAKSWQGWGVAVTDYGSHSGSRVNYGLRGGVQSASGALPYTMGQLGVPGGSAFGFWLNIAALPGSNLAVLEMTYTGNTLTGTSSEWLRVWVDTTGTIQGAATVGNPQTVFVTLQTMTPGTWYWVTMQLYDYVPTGIHIPRLSGQSWDQNGNSSGPDFGQNAGATLVGSPATPYNATLALGMDISGSGNTHWPTTGNNWISKVECQNATDVPTLLWMSTSDATTGTALYLMNQGVGSIATHLGDDSGHGIVLTPGGMGANLVATTGGPYI